MKYHIALHRPIDLEGITEDAKAHKCPQHSMWMLRQRLKATVHEPKLNSSSLIDKIRSKVVGRAEYWELARNLSSVLGEDDVIFCLSEAVGIEIATVCGAKKNRPKIAVFFHNIIRPRGLLALKLFGLADKIDLFFACSGPQVNFLRSYLNLPESRACFVWDSTDIHFFTPGPTSSNKLRPVIVSVGLEKRDYQTLAKATADLDVDVKISGFSQDAPLLARTFPKQMPNNMSRRFYEWPDLVQLYRDADIVVISLLENKYAAGVQVLMEAMACRRPVIVTRTDGLIGYLLHPGSVKIINPGDADELRQAIIHFLTHPQEAEAQAQIGYELALKRHNTEQFVEVIATKLESLN
ncbi:glycosyltransferase family 4 protein [Tolypothrix campylonemoides VB511288]|nr:glycosyltransferase family 4 protein [Tolypothrix campylonemoides VB511288]